MFNSSGVFNFWGIAGMSTISNIFFKRLASLLADKKNVSYDVVMFGSVAESFSPCCAQPLTVYEAP